MRETRSDSQSGKRLERDNADVRHPPPKVIVRLIRLSKLAAQVRPPAGALRLVAKPVQDDKLEGRSLDLGCVSVVALICRRWLGKGGQRRVARFGRRRWRQPKLGRQPVDPRGVEVVRSRVDADVRQLFPLLWFIGACALAEVPLAVELAVGALASDGVGRVERSQAEEVGGRDDGPSCLEVVEVEEELGDERAKLSVVDAHTGTTRIRRTSIGSSHAHCSSAGSPSHSVFPTAAPRLTIVAQSAQTPNECSHARPTTCDGTTSVRLRSWAWFVEASRM